MMVDNGIFATTAQVQDLVGANMSATYNVEAKINTYIKLAEGFINGRTRTNYSDTYAALNTDVQDALTLPAAALAAIMVIQADPSGVTRAEYETRMDALNFMFEEGMKSLEKAEIRTFINNE